MSFNVSEPGTVLQIPLIAGAPTVPQEGQLWENSLYGTFTCYLGGQTGALVRKIFYSAAQVVVSNTAAATSILPTTGLGSSVLAANYLNSGRTVHISLDGILNLNAATTVTVAFGVGSSTLATGTFTAAQLAAMTGSRINIDVRVICRAAAGTTSTLLSVGGMSATVAGQAYRSNADLDNNGTPVTTVNPSVANAVTLTVTFGAANANNSWTTNQVIFLEE